MNRCCLAFVLFALATPVALAQSTPATSTPPPAHTMANRPPPLTKDENDEINKAYAAAIKANPDLVSDQADLKQKQKELADAQKAYQQKLGDALVKADPNLADIVKTHPNLRPTVPPAPKAAKKPETPKKPKPAPKTSTASTNAAPASPTPPASGN